MISRKGKKINSLLFEIEQINLLNHAIDFGLMLLVD